MLKENFDKKERRWKKGKKKLLPAN